MAVSFIYGKKIETDKSKILKNDLVYLQSSFTFIIPFELLNIQHFRQGESYYPYFANKEIDAEALTNLLTNSIQLEIDKF